MSLVAVDVDATAVRAAFGALRRRLADLRGGWAQVGARMEEATVPYVPVLTGALVDSLTVEAGPAGVEIGSDLIYAGVQDRGWPGHGIEGHHFMDHAQDTARTDAVVVLAPEIQTLIDRVGLH